LWSKIFLVKIIFWTLIIFRGYGVTKIFRGHDEISKIKFCKKKILGGANFCGAGGQAPRPLCSHPWHCQALRWYQDVDIVENHAIPGTLSTFEQIWLKGAEHPRNPENFIPSTASSPYLMVHRTPFAGIYGIPIRQLP
jgi:hypothetical protein